MFDITCSFLLLQVAMFQEPVGGLPDEGLDVFCGGRLVSVFTINGVEEGVLVPVGQL